MSLGEDLRTIIIGSTGVQAVVSDISDAGKCQQNTIEQGTVAPFVWYQRSIEDKQRCLDGAVQNHTATFDVECVSDDIAEAQDLAAAIKTLLDGYNGALGNSFAQMVTVEDHTDGYLVKVATDEGIHVAALEVKIVAG